MFHKEQLKFIKLCLGISKIQLQQSNKQLHDTSNPGSVKPGSLKSARLSRKIIENSFYHLGQTDVECNNESSAKSSFKDTKWLQRGYFLALFWGNKAPIMFNI